MGSIMASKMRLPGTRQQASQRPLEYGAEVCYGLVMPSPDLATFRAAVAELSQGRAGVDEA